MLEKLQKLGSTIKHHPHLKFITIWISLLLIATGAFFIYTFYFNTSNTITSPLAQNGTPTTDANRNIIAPADNANDEKDFEGIKAITSGQDEKSALKNSKSAKDPSNTNENFNILILGIDRRHGNQTSWRTDVIQLVTLSSDRKKAIITHIPRDVWAGSYKINAVYNLQGPDAMKDIVEEVTGQRPDRVVRIDFDAFVWAVDAVGGISVNVPRGFVDNGYPNDRKGINEPITVEFKAGEQTMDGETALIYSRSRKGNNGEGSDYARGTRQQIIMKEIIKDFFKPSNLFKAKTAEEAFNIATKKMYTDATLSDAKVLFEVIKNYKDISMQNLSLDSSNYLYTPDASNYGGAWTLIAKNNDYMPVHQAIEELLK